MNGVDFSGSGGRTGTVRRLALASVLGVVAVIALTACAVAASGSGAITARTEALRLLTLVALPPGVRPSAQEPAGAGASLSYPPSVPVVPDLVDLHEFFVVSGTTPGAVIDWVQSHRPAGSAQDDSGDLPAWTSLDFGSVAGVVGMRELVVAAVQLASGAVGVRVDAQVVALPKLPGTGRGPGAVRVIEVGTMLGSFAFELRCDPAGGTVPHPARVCAAIRDNPALLYSVPGPEHSCPGFGEEILINGRWNDKPLRSSFSLCTGGQEQPVGDWGALLPSPSAEATVHTDRAIGLVHLGQSERTVIDLLGVQRAAPAPCGACIRDFNVGYSADSVQPVIWTVGFSRERVTQIENNSSALTIDGARASLGFTSLRRRLHGWSTRICAHARELVHSSATATTIIVYRTDFQRLIVTESAAASCSEAELAARRPAG